MYLIKWFTNSRNQNDIDHSGEPSDGNESDFSISSCSEKQVVVGICAMAKKTQSKPMKEILTRLREFEYIRMLVFEEDVILKVCAIFLFYFPRIFCMNRKNKNGLWRKNTDTILDHSSHGHFSRDGPEFGANLSEFLYRIKKRTRKNGKLMRHQPKQWRIKRNRDPSMSNNNSILAPHIEGRRIEFINMRWHIFF